MVEALTQLHHAGVLHGDPYPTNFMVEERPGQVPRVMVVDLELANYSQDQQAFAREMMLLKAILGLAEEA